MILWSSASSITRDVSWELWPSTMSRIGFPDLLRAVAWGIKDFSNHAAPMKSSVQPFGDVPMLAFRSKISQNQNRRNTNSYTISGCFSNHSGQNDKPGNTKPGLSAVPSAQIASIIVMSSRLALRCLYFARCRLE